MRGQKLFIAGQLKQGKTYQQIGDELGVTRQRIGQLVNKYGLKDGKSKVKPKKRYSPGDSPYNVLKDYWLYILKCSNDSYYVGITQDLNKRMDQHFSGKGSDHTKKYPPVSIPFAMCKQSTRWDVLRVEEFVQNDDSLILSLVLRDQKAINRVKQVWIG